MEITYKITNQELKKILSKELGVPVLEAITETDGNIIAKTAQEKKVPVGNISEMDIVREDFTNKFRQEKTERILSFFKGFFDGLKETTHPDHPDHIFFYKEKDGKKIGWMEQDLKNGYLWCRWDGFWSFLKIEIDLKYSEIQYVVKTMVEQCTERKIGTPRCTTGSLRGGRWNSVLNER